MIFVVMCFKLECKKILLCGGLRFVEAGGPWSRNRGSPQKKSGSAYYIVISNFLVSK